MEQWERMEINIMKDDGARMVRQQKAQYSFISSGHPHSDVGAKQSDQGNTQYISREPKPQRRILKQLKVDSNSNSVKYTANLSQQHTHLGSN